MKEIGIDHVHVDFEPSISVKKLWRKTRKLSRKYGNVWLPGLFNTYMFKLDLSILFIVFILEIVGLYFLGSAVRWKSIIFVGAAIAVILDIVLVLWSHARSGEICEKKNWIKVAEFDKSKDESRKLRNAIWINQMYTTLPANLLLLGLALGKIFFYVESKGGFDQILNPVTGGYDIRVLGVCAIYLVVFILHMFFTGYAIHGFWFKRRFRKESEQFEAQRKLHIVGKGGAVNYSDNQTNKFREFRISKEELEFAGVKALQTRALNAHFPYLEKDTTDNYHLYTWSILSDDELYSLAQLHQVSDKEKYVLGVMGLKHQLNMLAARPEWV